MLKNLVAIAAAFALTSVALTSVAFAHDIWVQSNTNVVRAGDAVQLSSMLGNHGNAHRDFKIAGKVEATDATLEVIDPQGKRYDLKDRLLDMGYAPNEGFWATSFVGTQPGLYTVVQTSDKVMSYAPVRDIKSAKTFFVVSKSLDKVPRINPGFDRRQGYSFELVPQSDPVTPMGPEVLFRVQLFYKGKPLPKTKVSFIPQGQVLQGNFDARYEQLTDEQGQASFTPVKAGYYLLSAHHEEADEKGAGYNKTNYSTTLTLYVPQICPCCS